MPDQIAGVIVDLGSICGCLYCLYFVCFRWPALIDTYGHFDLYFWVNCVVSVSGIVGSLLAVTYLAIWYSSAN